MTSGHRSAWRRRSRSRAARIAIPLAIPMALGLTLGIVLAISFSLLGAIIASRQPENRIGWIYLSNGLLVPKQSLGDLYYQRSVISGGLPGAHWAAWLPCSC